MPCLAEFAGQRLRHGQQCGLGHLVGAVLGVGVPDHHRVDVDHRTLRLGQRRVKPWISRSAPSTVSSMVSRMWSKVVLAKGFMDGTRNALLISTSTLPYAFERLLDEVVHLCLVGDVGAHRHRAPAQVGDLPGHIVEALHSPSGQHQIRARLGASLGEGGAQRRAHATDDDDLVPASSRSSAIPPSCRRSVSGAGQFAPASLRSEILF